MKLQDNRAQSRRLLPDWRNNDGYGIIQTALETSAANLVTASSDSLNWPNLHAALTDEHPHETMHRSVPALWIAMHLNYSRLTRTIGSHTESKALLPFQLSILAPNTPIEVGLANHTTTLHITLRASILEEVAVEYFDADPKNLEVDSVLGFEDQGLNWLLKGIQRELLDPDPQSGLKMEYLSRTLASDVLRLHGRMSGTAEKSKTIAALSVNQFNTIKEYLINHIGDTVHLADLAKLCGMGRTSFICRFRQTTGKSPHAYIMSMRLRQAKHMLADPTHSLCNIAYACGFCDQAHFTKLFKRFYGIQPSHFRREIA